MVKDFAEHDQFYKENYDKGIAQTCGDSDLKCVITYRHQEDGVLKWQAFPNRQEALTWLYDNCDRLTRFFCLKQFEEKRKPMVNNFRTIDVQMINPGNDKVLSKKTLGAYDSCADLAAFPYKQADMNDLFHTMSWVNGKLKPVVYAKLKVDDLLLKPIYEVQLENRSDWCAIGIPQMMDLSETKVRQIMDDTRIKYQNTYWL